MFGAANKRINRLDAAALRSPALVAVTEGAKNDSYQGRYKTGKFYLSDFDTKSMRNNTGDWHKERNKLINEMTRASLFLDDKTSTVSGARKYLDNINKRWNQSLQYEDLAEFFNGYHRWLEEYVPAYNNDKRYEYVEQYKSYLLNNTPSNEPDFETLDDDWIEL